MLLCLVGLKCGWKYVKIKWITFVYHLNAFCLILPKPARNTVEDVNVDKQSQMKSKAKLFLFFNTLSLIHLDIDGKIKLNICMYCRLMGVIFPACFVITYNADFLTKQINTVGNIT